MVSATTSQQFLQIASMWNRSIAVAVTVLLAACLTSCGDAGAPASGPDGANIAPQILAPTIAAAAGPAPVTTNIAAPKILAPTIATAAGQGSASTDTLTSVRKRVFAAISQLLSGSNNDFDGDGKSDILWRNSDGRVAVWLMNGMAAKSEAVVSPVTADWTNVGMGDFDGDGKSDILWRNSDGRAAIWLMNGMAAKSEVVVSTVTTDWTIAGTGDFDGDGKSDILWRNSNGEVAIWLMNGIIAKAGVVVSTVTNDWTIARTGDFDGDGKSDILWQKQRRQSGDLVDERMAANGWRGGSPP